MALVVFSVFYLNLFLCFGLGIREFGAKKHGSFQLVYPWIILFVTTFFLWIFFERILSSIPWFPWQFLLYPLSLFAGFWAERFLLSVVSAGNGHNERTPCFRLDSEYGCFSPAALFLTIHLAEGFSEALFLSFTFSAGGLLVCCVSGAILKRSVWESLPRPLAGTPILLVSMGLVSLIFSAAAMIILKAFRW